jgi:chitinase
VCWFANHNIYVTKVYDDQACSPYLFSGTEWISYDDDRSLECKTKFIKDNQYGGAMIFSLNCDDFNSHCDRHDKNDKGDKNNNFPLANKIRSILFDAK